MELGREELRVCRRAAAMVRRWQERGRGVYIVRDATGHLHAFLSQHKPGVAHVATVGLTESGDVDFVWDEVAV